jgi:hypothetical protein
MAFFDRAGACVVSAVLLLSGVAHAAIVADKCESAKLKIAGQYDFCRLKAEATAAKTGAMPDFSNCNSAYSAKWTQAEMKAGGMCLSNGDQASVQAYISEQTNALGVALAGAPLPACGNGVIDPGEQCDQSNLNAQTCASQGFAGGVLKCGPGCVFDTSGCSASRFVDNGDGTVSDLRTGLMWEKKVAAQCVNLVNGQPISCFNDADCNGNGGGGTCVSCLQCVNARYTWTASPPSNPYPPDGTAFAVFLYGLDAGTSPDGVMVSGCFAGHCDWRLPSIGELEGIEDTTRGVCGGGSGACIDPVFGPTQDSLYFSTTMITDPGTLWEAEFGGGGELNGGKGDLLYVRAVRGGS